MCCVHFYQVEFTILKFICRLVFNCLVKYRKKRYDELGLVDSHVFMFFKE